MAKTPKALRPAQTPHTSAPPPAEPAASYDVGYCKPPKHSRFREGRSGNPKGRPKRPPTIDREMREALEQALGRKVPVKEGERTRVITFAQAGIEQLVHQYARGDRHARRDVIMMAERLGIDLTRGAHDGEAALLPGDHQKILDAFVARRAGHAPDPNQSPRALAPPEFLTDDEPDA